MNKSHVPVILADSKKRKQMKVCIPKSSKGFRWIPYRMTINYSDPVVVYRWLWFNWYWIDNTITTKYFFR